MADWTDQDTNSLLPGEPWTSAKALAAFENPVALAEGATGSPEIHTNWVPYNIATGGDGVIWDFDVDGAVGIVETPTFESRFEYSIWADGLTIDDSNSIGVFVYRVTDDAWITLVPGVGDDYGFLTLSEVDPSYFRVDVFSATVARRFHAIEWQIFKDYTFTDGSIVANGDGVTGTLNQKNRIEHAATDTISKLKIETKTAGTRTLESGKVYLYRRLCYV